MFLFFKDAALTHVMIHHLQIWKWTIRHHELHAFLAHVPKPIIPILSMLGILDNNNCIYVGCFHIKSISFVTSSDYHGTLCRSPSSTSKIEIMTCIIKLLYKYQISYQFRTCLTFVIFHTRPYGTFKLMSPTPTITRSIPSTKNTFS